MVSVLLRHPARRHFAAALTSRLTTAAPRTTSTLPVPPPTPEDVPQWHPVYTFPYIRAARAVCRLKIYQTGITCVAVPYAGHLTFTGAASPSTVIVAFLLNGLALAMLYVMGEGFRRLVGRIYCSGDCTNVKVSHLTFWGGRNDVTAPAADFVPLSDTSDAPTDAYVHVLRYSQPDEALILPLRFGGVLDKERFERVFGSPDPNVVKIQERQNHKAL